jgi:hypothetical protein
MIVTATDQKASSRKPDKTLQYPFNFKNKNGDTMTSESSKGDMESVDEQFQSFNIVPFVSLGKTLSNHSVLVQVHLIPDRVGPLF